MRIVTLNVNGIRAAARKGLFDWLARERADVVCLQEVRAQADQIAAPQFHPAPVPLLLRAGPAQGLQRRRALQPPRAGRGRAGLRLGGIRCGGPLPRGPLWRPQHRLPLRAVGLLQRGAPAGQVPLHDGVQGSFGPAGPGCGRQGWPPVPAVWRLEHRPQGNRPEELAQQPEELRLPARGTQLARRRLRPARLHRLRFAR